MLSIISSFTLPFVLVAGVFGMNLDSLPIHVDFWQLMGITFALSLLVLGLLLYLLRRSKPK